MLGSFKHVGRVGLRCIQRGYGLECRVQIVRITSQRHSLALSQLIPSHHGSAPPPLISSVNFELPPMKLHLDTLPIYKLTSRKFTSQNDLYQKYQSKRAIVLIQTKFTNYKCLHMKFTCEISGWSLSWQDEIVWNRARHLVLTRAPFLYMKIDP